MRTQYALNRVSLRLFAFHRVYNGRHGTTKAPQREMRQSRNIDMQDNEKFSREGRIAVELAGLRLDQAASQLFPEFSRARLQQWISAGSLLMNGRQARPKDRVNGGESLTLEATLLPEQDWGAEDIPLDIVFEDADLLVINKPAGLVVHPAAGNRSGTLLNALLHHVPGLALLPRAGIVHRLDKDTSGLMVVAKTLSAHAYLVEAMQHREISREYLALVVGTLTAGGTVDAPLGRHPVHRTRRAVVKGTLGKAAVSHYRLAERFRAHTLLNVKLETGRTHQIRVHMAHIAHPLVGDPAYGGRLRIPRACSSELREALQGFGRQALHAVRLGLVHPESGEWLSWERPVPADMATLLEVLREDEDHGAV